MENLSQTFIDQLVRDVTGKKNIFGAVFYASSADENVDFISAYGNFNEDSRYYIASINKLFISALVLRLHSTGKLNLTDKILQYLPLELVKGLHNYKGRDFSNQITILHLISHTSGLPCYLTDKQPNGVKAMKELEAGIDQAWPIGKVIDTVKTMKPHFPPGKEGKAKYADTNHQILSLIIEQITGKPINIVLESLFQELNLSNTYVCDDSHDISFIPIRYKSNIVSLPVFLNSTHNDIISTAKDQMKFLKAFFSGYFFPMEDLPELEKWNNIFFPFKYGIGIQKFYLPRILSPTNSLPNIVGHCGSTGSLAFYIPEMQLYITGTVNQQASPQVAFKALIKIVSKARAK